MKTQTIVEFWVCKIDEYGDIIDQDSTENENEAISEFLKIELDDEVKAVILEKRKAKWNETGKVGTEFYQVMRRRGNVKALTQGNWELQTELQPA